MHYLDANATEPLRPAALAAVLAALEVTGNPSSVHGAGRASRRVVEDARTSLATRFGGRPQDLVFTSGATEANALAIHALAGDGGNADRGVGRRVIVGATEHDAVRAAAPDAAVLPVDRHGVVDLGALPGMLDGLPKHGGPALVCLMLANNETGTLQPIAEAAALCRRLGARLHVDAVQAAGRIAVDLAALGAHSLALSSHKLGGPMGAGALLLAPEVSAIAALIRGGGQERGRRGGTPPVPAIAGFAAAAAAAFDPPTLAVPRDAIDPPTLAVPRDAIDPPRLARLRDAIERIAMDAGAVVCGGGAQRLANTTCLALPGVRADAQVIALDLDGIAVSAGAACSSGKVAASHVLAAMGLGALAGEAIRVSLPWNATTADVEAFANAYPRMAARLREALASRAA
jgi:cysteine desulfurase